MEFRNLTIDFFDWYTEYELYGLIDPYTGSHPELAADFPGVLLEEYTPGPVDTVGTKILDPNAIASAADANSGITNTTGGYDYSTAPITILKINPTPEAENDNEHEYSENNDNYEYYGDYDEKVEEV